jgi:hypothetical protein
LGASKCSILREHGIGNQMLAKILINPESDHQLGGPRPKPKLGEFLGVIDEILAADKDCPAETAPHRTESGWVSRNPGQIKCRC